ncbi:MAG: tetratricopeptide repeat protein, partial [Planctomycetota bacterium]
RRFFSTGAGIIAGLIGALYAPAVFFDALIQKASLDFFFMCVLLWLLGRIGSRLTNWTVLVMGVMLGCFALTRENVVLFVPVIAVWLLTRYSSLPMKRRVAGLVMFAVGLAVVLVPVGLRNKYIGGSFLITTAQFGPNFYIGNHEHATGCSVPLRPGRDDPAYERVDATDIAQQALGRSLTPSEVSDYWVSQATAWIRSNPGAWLRLLWVKLVWLINSYEVPDAEDFYYHGIFSPALRVLGTVMHFGVLAPLAVGGMLLTWKRWREVWILHALLATIAVSIVAFFVVARYRLPMVPILILFAGVGIVEAVRKVRLSGVLSIDLVAVAVGLAAVPVNWRLIDPSSHTAMARSNMGSAFLLAGKTHEAIGEFEEAVRIDPKLSTTYANLANAYWRDGRLPDSIASLRRALELRPGDVDLGLDLGNALAEQGDFAEAEPLLRAAMAIAHRRPEVYSSLGVLLVKQKQWTEAIEVMRNGATVAPEQVSILANLAWNLATCPVDGLRDGAVAVQLAEMCCKRTAFRDARAFDVLAAAYAEAGRFEEAVVAQQRAMQIAAKQPGTKGAEEFEGRLKLYQGRKAYRRAE